MRTLLTAFTLVLMINALALGGLMGWMGATGRLSKERMQEAVEVFSKTVDEEEALAAEAQAAEEEAVALAERAMRLEQVAGGPVTPEQRLTTIQRVDENQQAVLKRQQVEAEALKRQLDTQMRRIEERIAELKKKEQAFEEAIAAQFEAMEDGDFKEAVAMLEGLPPKQAKQVLQQMLAQGSMPQVVDYLSAMQQRKAAAVLTEFKLPNEVAQAAELIERLRQRTQALQQEASI